MALARLVCGLLLVGVLFYGVFYDQELYVILDHLWQRTVSIIGLKKYLPPQLQPSGSFSHLINRPVSIPGVILHSILYVFTSLVLLFLVLDHPLQRRFILLLYCSAFTCSFFLLLVSRTSNMTAIAVLNSNLIHFIVSPLPIIILIPSLRWYLMRKYSEVV
jgi:hypothetical protein